MKTPLCFAFAFSLMVAASAAAQASPSSPKLPDRGRWVHDRSNPYSRLFQSPAPILVRQAPKRETPAPLVKCGMTMIPGDPSIDPHFVKPVPRDSTRFPMRVVEPAICR
jgi:hypothetical protein